MLKRILVTGAVGFVALAAWALVVNGLFGFTARIEMNRIPNERAVYALLKQTVVAPGAYVVNPETPPGQPFPAGEPVFSVRYAGFGHEAAGRLLFVEVAVGAAAAILAATLLSMASSRVLSRYASKAVFVAGIGVLLAVAGDLPRFGIGGYPAGSALLLAANRVLSWTVAGLVMARSMRAPSTAAGGA